MGEMEGSRAEESDTDTDPLGRGGDGGAHRRLRRFREWIGGAEVRRRGPFAVGRAGVGVRARKSGLTAVCCELCMGLKFRHGIAGKKVVF